MNKLQLLASVVLAFSLGGKALAQAQDGDPQRLQGIIQQFQNMSPEQMETMRERFQNMREEFLNMAPQKRREMIEQFQKQREEFQNMDPQQQREVLQQFSSGADPQQMLQTMQKKANESLRERMGVTDAEEWSLIEQRIAAVKKARAALMAYGNEMMGMLGMGGGFGVGRGGISGPTSPEGKALKQGMDSDAPEEQTENLLASFRAARKEKEAALVAAQNELQSVLTMRQEAIATLVGLLD